MKMTTATFPPLPPPQKKLSEKNGTVLHCCKSV